MTLSPDVCVLCFRSGDTNEHLSMCCPISWRLCIRVSNVFREEWVCPPTLLLPLQGSYKDFGVRREVVEGCVACC